MTDRADQIRASRERQIERQQQSKLRSILPDHFDTTVVGVTFTPFYPGNLLSLEQALFEADMKGEPLAAIIVREPDNEYDPNACAVHVPALGEEGKIGYLTRPLASRLAPELDNGARWQATVRYLKIHDDHLSRPGIEIHLERKANG